MCIAAAEEIASVAEEEGLDVDKIIPSMSEWEVFPREAAAVGVAAVKQGLARVKLSRKALYDRANEIITHARRSTELLMRRGLIKGFPVKTRGRNERRLVQR
jgi:malate dehydrogenase (oxaloacetate-decarboxylating)